MSATSTDSEQTLEVLQIHSVTETRAGLFCFSDEFQHRLGFVDREAGGPTFVGGEGTELGQFRYPSGLVTWQGSLLVCDTWNHRVQVLGPNGEVQQAFGRYGPDADHFDCPLDLAVSQDGEHLWVLDSGNHAVKVFDRQFQLVTVWDHHQLALEPPVAGAAFSLKTNPGEKQRTLHYPRRLFLQDDRWLVMDNHGGTLFRDKVAVRRFTNFYSCYLKPLRLFDEWGLFYYSVDRSLRALDFSGAFDVTLQTLAEDTVTVYHSEDTLFRCDAGLRSHELAWPSTETLLAHLSSITPDQVQAARCMVRLGGGSTAFDTQFGQKGCPAPWPAFFRRLDEGTLSAEDAQPITDALNHRLLGLESALAALKQVPVAYLPHIRPYGPMPANLAADTRLKKSYLTFSAAKIFDDLQDQTAFLAELTAALPQNFADQVPDDFWVSCCSRVLESGARVFAVKKDALAALYNRIKDELGGIQTPKALAASLQTDFWLEHSDEVHHHDAMISAADRILSVYQRVLAGFLELWGTETLPEALTALNPVIGRLDQEYALSHVFFDACRAHEPVLQACDPLFPTTAFAAGNLPIYTAFACAGTVESWGVDQVERGRSRACSVAAGNLVFLAQQRFFQTQTDALREFFLLPTRFALHSVGTSLARCGQYDLLDEVTASHQEPFFSSRKTHELEMAGIETLMGRFPSAANWLQKWIQPGAASVATLHLAYLEAASGQGEAAEKRFAALSDDPMYPLFFGRAAPFLNQIETAVSLIETRCTVFSLDLFLVYCGLLNLQGACEKALQFQSEQGDQPGWSRHLVAANSLWGLGRVDEALTRLQTLPAGTSAWLDTEHAALLRAKGDDEQAAALVASSLSKRPGFMPMLHQQLMGRLKADDASAAAQILVSTRAWLFTRDGALHGDQADFLSFLGRMLAVENTPKPWGEDPAADAVALNRNTVHPYFRLV